MTTSRTATLLWSAFLSLTLVLTACTGAVPASLPTSASSISQVSAAGRPTVPPSSLAAASEKRLAIIEKGDWTFIKNGATVDLGKGLSVELSLTPYPPTQLTAELNLYITRGGQPVTDASAGVIYDMLGMVHGPFTSATKSLGNGHYLLVLDYIMFSAWEHKLVLDLAKDRYELGVGLVLFPGPG